MVSYGNERILFRDMNDLTLESVFVSLWASMIVDQMHHIASNSSRHASSMWLYYHYSNDPTGNPATISIVCHAVHWHPSPHGTRSRGNQLFAKAQIAKAQIAKLNKVTELEVTELTTSTVNVTAFTILKIQGSGGIPIGRLQKKFTFVFRLYWYVLNWQTMHSKLAAKDFHTAEFIYYTWNCYLMLGFVLDHIPCNTISILELWWSYNALPRLLFLPSASTLMNIRWR